MSGQLVRSIDVHDDRNRCSQSPDSVFILAGMRTIRLESRSHHGCGQIVRDSTGQAKKPEECSERTTVVHYRSNGHPPALLRHKRIKIRNGRSPEGSASATHEQQKRPCDIEFPVHGFLNHSTMRAAIRRIRGQYWRDSSRCGSQPAGSPSSCVGCVVRKSRNCHTPSYAEGRPADWDYLESVVNEFQS
jgi:hypothetical protein